MFRKISDFQSVWKYETMMTLKLYAVLTDELMQSNKKDSFRDIQMLTKHINRTVTELPHTAGLPLEINEITYTDVKSLMEHYEKDCAILAEALNKAWTDDQLEDKIPMYGMEWEKGTTLHILVTHQTHHRGQLTVLMRQAGLVIPGMYGPAKQEWEQMGMKAEE
jgi:uncharacterized damage-inducible protein DinB